MTGSAIALPLLGAGSATAADATTWDRVAECESGGMWSADLGNGFYGGLQMSQETWESYGGLAHAPRPDLASRAQQISVAEKVYAATGAKAWETCAPIAGLGGATAAPADPTATTPAPGATDPAETLEDPDAPGATAPARPTDPVGSLLPGDPAEPAAPPASGTPGTPASGTGKHRGEPAKEETPATGPAAPTAPAGTAAPTAPAEPAAPGAPGTATGETGDKPADPTKPAVPGNTDDERETGAHPSRGDGATRDPGSVEPGAYTVRPGDNLSAIADEQGVAGGWAALYQANQGVVGGDPDLILPGQSLELTADQP
ncbi:transglycosylase family protein [Streptomyces sp. NPDC015131]|uniref:transglycosylase family protein n=1 Tax=Streptomyces sp. NPDC015131 TaxID=3364941 RepID=UPI00370330D2